MYMTCTLMSSQSKYDRRKFRFLNVCNPATFLKEFILLSSLNFRVQQLYSSGIYIYQCNLCLLQLRLVISILPYGQVY